MSTLTDADIDALFLSSTRNRMPAGGDWRTRERVALVCEDLRDFARAAIEADRRLRADSEVRATGEAADEIAGLKRVIAEYEGTIRALNNALERDSDRSTGAVPAEEVQWIVNDLGELGVRVGTRFLFLYKGDSIEYGSDPENTRDGVALHDDGTPMRWRMVGKREFGEVQWPAAWLLDGRRQDRYTVELHYTPGLSFGNREDGDWRDLPAAAPIVPEEQGERVQKTGGSFQHTGTVVARFQTTAGEPRIVLEFDAPVAGMLHVYRPDQVVPIAASTPEEQVAIAQAKIQAQADSIAAELKLKTDAIYKRARNG